MASAAEKERILVVDDAPDTLELIERNLRAHRYEVFTAPGVAEAIRILDSVQIDLVITDLKMPKVSGMDLVRHIRENLRDTQVMMITGYPTVEGGGNGHEDRISGVSHQALHRRGTALNR